MEINLIYFIVIIIIIVAFSSKYLLKLIRQQSKTVGDYVSFEENNKVIMGQIVEEINNSVKVEYWDAEGNICIRRTVILDRDELL